ncbi:MAG: hypothetical protein NTX28_16320 [Novosphingobium sp.]|nr:hypothetical protein [Novosphingobium sp.]
MIGKIVSAMVGKKIAERTSGLSEGSGALVGLAAATVVPRVLRRMGPGGMVAAATGGWLLSRYMKKKETGQVRARY